MTITITYSLTITRLPPYAGRAGVGLQNFHPLEALFPDFGSDVSNHWKQPFHPSEAKHHPLAFKVSSAGLRNFIRPKAKYHPPEMAFY